jgi:hypothetical protein
MSEDVKRRFNIHTCMTTRSPSFAPVALPSSAPPSLDMPRPRSTCNLLRHNTPWRHNHPIQNEKKRKREKRQ